MARGENSGNVTLTASGAVISSGTKVRVYNVIGLAGANSILSFYDGTSASGTLIDVVPITANTPARVNYENGKLFASGCYVNVAGSITGCNLECSSLL